jgi:hypothetical protein
MTDFTRLLRFALLLLLAPTLLRAADRGTGPNLLSGSFESGFQTYNPWAGVDETGHLRVWTGTQQAVEDDGRVNKENFSPSVAVGDLNGDGLPDLVVADPRGFFWFFPNSGKPDAPAFTQGEIMPIWLDVDPRNNDVVPRIQLVDYDGDGKLDLVAGTWIGELYYLHNTGSPTNPEFKIPDDRSAIKFFTHSNQLLWCNYLSPFLFDWTKTGRLDLVMGDGTYSANSIYYFVNQGSNSRPIFKEDRRTRIIPGMGLEHLTPQVIDWNNDGKPDIISGDRTGCITYYLNQSTDPALPPVFAPGQHVLFGSRDRIGAFSTVCAADLNHDGLFDLVVGTIDGGISYSLNIGTPGAPKFGPLVPITGVYPYGKIILPRTWEVDRYHPFGAPNELLTVTNATVEPGFAPPPAPEFTGKGALKFSMTTPQVNYFKQTYYPPHVSDTDWGYRRTIEYGSINMLSDTRYILSFWVRTQGDVSDLRYVANVEQPGVREDSQIGQIGDQLDTSTSWNLVSQSIRIPSKTEVKKVSDEVNLKLTWTGDGTVYFDDFSLRKAE